jgi:hypothetical protein
MGWVLASDEPKGVSQLTTPLIAASKLGRGVFSIRLPMIKVMAFDATTRCYR